jgi:hypothetical protein
MKKVPIYFIEKHFHKNTFRFPEKDNSIFDSPLHLLSR